VSSRPPEQSGEAKEGQGLCPLDPTKGSAVITIYLIDVSMDFQYFCYTTHAYTHAPNRTVLILQQQSGTTGLLGHPPKIPRPSVDRSRGPVPSPRTDT
jgi:hypothetical protein